ncbi:M20 family metallopeptidase [Paenibacillus doosanensis]|uniref:Hydrolase YxeP n=1 Tax=Paenibacillus konkukensis TaxID=2020716 RepID=A0ABY4RUG8_9BACL|nr:MULTISPECIES: M20 family metallopeptidase [Paenibacillus]MCS7462011.1 M20 family metallopeptidase [Paenibacillus doosanensis]UQZ85072.1 putative hydrolase YxeP [Paenibacillus konkukensis]
MTSLPLQSLLARSEVLKNDWIAFRRDLHQYPELSHRESRTAEKVASFLRGLGLQPQTGVGGHGVVAELQGAEPGPVIALRADMDALPIAEETGLPYASREPGVMHACGHDAHTAILLGAAQLLAERRQELSGAIRFIFQGAEETNAGAKAMVQAGVLNGIEEIYGLHNLPTLPVGMIATGSGPFMGSVDRVEIMLEGQGGHGAIPDRCHDPIVAASAVVMGLQTAVSREISPFEPAVITIGSFQAGEANNVIPQYAKLTGTVRTFSSSLQRTMKERIERLAGQIGGAYRCRVQVAYIPHVAVLVNDPRCVYHIEQTADVLIGKERRTAASPTLAGEDFSVYLEHRPGCFFWLGSGPREGAEQAYGLHHPKFAIEENCIPLGAALLASAAWQRGSNIST